MVFSRYLNTGSSILISIIVFVSSVTSCNIFHNGKNIDYEVAEGGKEVVMDGDGDYLMCVIREGHVEFYYPSPWNSDIDAYGRNICHNVNKWLKNNPVADEIYIPYTTVSDNIDIRLSLRGGYKKEITLGITYNEYGIPEIIEALDEFNKYCAREEITRKIIREAIVIVAEYDSENKSWFSYNLERARF